MTVFVEVVKNNKCEKLNVNINSCYVRLKVLLENKEVLSYRIQIQFIITPIWWKVAVILFINKMIHYIIVRRTLTVVTIQLPVQSVPITTNVVSFESSSWRGVLDTTLCDQVCQ
jgi:hypothetical protein